MKKTFISGVAASLLFVVTGVTAKSTSHSKHLAGPAEEIELMQKANPEANAIISKHSMLPVEFERDQNGHWVWQKNILVDGDNPKVLLLGAERADWQLSIKSHQDKSLSQNLPFTQHKTTFGMGSEQFPATQFDLENMASGEYQLGVKADSKREGFILVSSDSPYRLKSYTSRHGGLLGEPVAINASAFNSAFSVVKSDLQLMEQAFIRITAPDGVLAEKYMFDDGMASDKSAFDGEFSAAFVPNQVGIYQVQVVAQGITPEGQPFMRTVEHLIPVIQSDLIINAKSVTGSYSAPHKIDLALPVSSELKRDRFRIKAEVWGTKTDQSGSEPAAVSWLSTIAEIKAGELMLQLDDRWLLSAGVSAPYTLKNISIEDVDHFITVLETGSLPLNLPVVTEKSRADYDGGLYESMLKGERPAELDNQDKAAGGKVMLVHGYCSDGSWRGVEYQFYNHTNFLDLNKNRSHDTFARLIDAYGDNFPSFGIVAHSQGGAAALHLYSYYWSGLDNAGPGRLIQSVGTPYQGTPLAGAIAALGEIFGVRCGANSNLTVSGGAAWLSGIPTWARNKVNYYTTSFTDKWWRYDYCNLASDVILSDPDDGVIEKSRGQVSGAINRGHTTGQCHVTGMRDMAQTRDSGRNAVMNSNAAR